MRLFEAMCAEVDAALSELATRQAQDLFRGAWHPVKIYSDGAGGAEPTWIGRCKICGWRYVTNRHWPRHSKMPDRCGRPRQGYILPAGWCYGEVERDPNSDALLSVFLLNGYDAIQDRPDQPNVLGLEAFFAPNK